VAPHAWSPHTFPHSEEEARRRGTIPPITEINPSVANRSRIDHKTALGSTSRGASARMLRSAWYSSKCLIEGDDRYVDVSLALGDCVLRLKLRALGI
jgi:hypothetical protein